MKNRCKKIVNQWKACFGSINLFGTNKRMRKHGFSMHQLTSAQKFRLKKSKDLLTCEKLPNGDLVLQIYPWYVAFLNLLVGLMIFQAWQGQKSACKRHKSLWVPQASSYPASVVCARRDCKIHCQCKGKAAWYKSVEGCPCTRETTKSQRGLSNRRRKGCFPGLWDDDSSEPWWRRLRLS